MFCGQYIDINTVVHIDHNAFNYTKANERLMELDNSKIFGVTVSCRWITIYMSCLSIYPRCNITTQALVAPCMNNCLNYINRCNDVTHISSILTASAMLDNNPLDEKFILNCSAPFRIFGSVNIDTDNCYEFNCKLIYGTIKQPSCKLLLIGLTLYFKQSVTN